MDPAPPPPIQSMPQETPFAEFDPSAIISDKSAGRLEMTMKLSVLGIVLAVYLVLTNLSSYISVYPFCRVSIEESVLYGNRQTIVQALDLIKSQDPKSFNTVCGNVSTITEDNCLIYNSPTPPTGATQELSPTSDGCYVKGTKNIYLTPVKTVTQEVIAARAESIKKYAAFSQSFWASQ